MPYIDHEFRSQFDQVLRQLPECTSKGELEYCIFWLMQRYRAERPDRYAYLHDCCYAAQHCADEFRRRYLDQREDLARMQNGDILTLCKEDKYV